VYKAVDLLQKAVKGEFPESEIAAWIASGRVTPKELSALLREAAAHDALAIVKRLVAAGANPYEEDGEGRTAFNRAASNGLHALAWLTEEAFADTQKPASQKRWRDYELNTLLGRYKSTLITYAAKACSAAVIEKMIAAGANIGIVNDSGWTLLHCAAVMPGRAEVLKLLIDAFRSDETLAPKILALSTHEYRTKYGDQEVVYAEGLTAAGLCRARRDQDLQHPPELVDYLRIFGAAGDRGLKIDDQPRP
jgi:hypothetical protein